MSNKRIELLRSSIYKFNFKLKNYSQDGEIKVKISAGAEEPNIVENAEYHQANYTTTANVEVSSKDEDYYTAEMGIIGHFQAKKSDMNQSEFLKILRSDGYFMLNAVLRGYFASAISALGCEPTIMLPNFIVEVMEDKQGD